MAKAPRQLSNQFRFSASPIALDRQFDRRPIKLLPPVHQTETLTKFFGATADHLFSKGKSKPMNGYVGKHVSYEKSYDTYISDSDPRRDFYQLEPTMVSKTDSGENSAVLFYDDLINKLRYQGAIVDDHSRMFTQEYYSWSPYIDIDKFINFREYVWLPEGPTAINVYGHSAAYIGDDVTQMFPLTSKHPAPVKESEVKVTVDGVEVPFTYNDGNVFLTPPPVKKSNILVFTAFGLDAIEGKPTFAVTNGVTFTNGLRILVKNDVNTKLVGKIFIIEGVGDSITFVEDKEPDLTLEEDYITIARGGDDANQWAKTNRWFHRTLAEKGSGVQARRPIIEFNRNVVLFNSGTSSRGSVDLIVHSVSNFYASINGLKQSSVKFDGVTITKKFVQDNGGQVFVLVINEARPEINNRKYRVRVNSDDEMVVTLYADGGNASGFPEVGETMAVNFGATYGGTEVYWNGTAWIISQKKSTVNQSPLFTLFDENGIAIDDPITYPNSTFKGSRLFGYDNTGTMVDSVLGFLVNHSAKGDFLFTNYLATESYSYKIGVTETSISSNLYFEVKNAETPMLNGWHKVSHNSQQWVVDRFVAAAGKKMFKLSQEPATSDDIQVFKNGIVQKEGKDYIRQYASILFVVINDNDRVVARTYNPLMKAKETPGLYEIPLNLSANPGWERIETTSQGDLHRQFAEIIANQKGLVGTEYATNNYRDLKVDYSLGNSIISHTSPLLATMLLASSDDIDFINSARYSEQEYARFRGKFDKKIREFIVSNKLTNAPVADMVSAAIAEINTGLTNEFAFSDSNVARTTAAKTFIPATPSWFGGYPVQEPSIYSDPISNDSFIIGHDGSYIPLFGDLRDQANLELEKRIFASIPDYVKEKSTGYIDYKSIVSTRDTTQLYTHAEDLTILRPMFEKWCVNQNVSYKQNRNFNANDAFTWNYSSVKDIDGNEAPGNWRGIFNRFYGTDRPNTHPWEMIGFHTKPTWWKAVYGEAPFTSDNKILWDDIASGTIAEGSTAGVYPELAKAVVNRFVPVDDQGNLRDPIAVGLVPSPTLDDARLDWKFGDYSPAESAWRKSYWYPFARLQTAYLMRPAVVVETLWDTERQTISGSTRGAGYPYADRKVYGEADELGLTVRPNGIQQWIYDYLTSRNKDVTEHFGNKVRGLGVSLAYKVSGFTDSQNLRVTSDVIQTLPNENVQVELYTSPSIREEFIGGVIIQNIGNGWKVFGYDILDPAFKVIPPDYYGGSTNVTVSSTRKNVTPDWMPVTFYPRGVTVRFKNDFYSVKRPHTSSQVFESDFWTVSSRPSYADEYSVPYYKYPNKANNVERVMYGSIMRTPLDVSIFLAGYENYLLSRGFKFEDLDAETTEPVTWRSMLRKFMSWTAESGIQVGDSLSLFPSTEGIKFETDHGNIRAVEQLVNGVYSILDQNGYPIQPEYTNVVRDKGEIKVTPVGNQIPYSLRLSLNSIEHIILIDNTTIFGDKVYDPLYNSRQERMLLEGYKTTEWKGRIDAPGFIVTDNLIRPNYEKSAEMIRSMFEVENFEPMTLMERARANIGYFDKLYMNDLRVNGTNQFEFFKGMIQQKGTHSALSKLFRSSYISSNSNTEFLEEWAFRTGDFGYVDSRPSMDFMLRQSDFSNDPQLFEFSMSGQGGWDSPNGWDNDHWDGIVRGLMTVTKNISVNGLRSIEVSNKGKGYKNAPIVKFPGDTSGASATATLDWSVSAVETVDIIKGGTGFFEGDLITFNGIGEGAQARVQSVNYGSSRVKSVEIVGGKAGAGHKVGDIFKVEGGTSARGRVTSVDADGAVTGVLLVASGQGYGPGSFVQFTGFNNSAAESMKVEITGGALKDVIVTSGGVGYDYNTTPMFTGTGINAELKVNVAGASVTFITLDNPGSGFGANPAVVLEGGDPVIQATAIVEVDTATDINGTINLVSFLRSEAVSIRRIIVKVNDAFNGVQPLVSVGDDEDKARYAGPYFLSNVDTHVVTFDAEEITTNALKDLNVYVSNSSESGGVTVLIEFAYTPDYYSELFKESTDSDKSVEIIDLFEKGAFEQRNKRWISRYDTELPNWPLRSYGQFDKGNLPNAGYVHLDDIEWTARNYNEFLELYSDEKQANPSTAITKSVDITYEDGFTGIRKIKLIGDLAAGLYRVKSFLIDIEDAFPLTAELENEVTISIGTMLEPEKFVAKSSIFTNRVYASNQLVFEFVKAEDDSTEIYAFVEQLSGLAISPGSMTVSSEIELMGKSIIPDQNAWCYDVVNGRWDVFRFANTGANVAETHVPSFEGQGTVVATDRDMFLALGFEHNWFEPRGTETNEAGEPVDINPTFYSDIAEIEARLSKTVIDGTSNGSLGGVYKAKVHNTVKGFINAADHLTTSTAGIVKVSLMDVVGASNLVVNRIRASVVRPFLTPSGTNPTLTIGTIGNPNQFVGAVASSEGARFVMIAPSRPSFTYAKQATVDVYDTQMTVYENEDKATVRLVRSGNIFVTPSSIIVKNGGYGYGQTSNPKVTVIGPTGVEATAHIRGRIVGFTVLDGGNEYVTPPIVTFMGGNGQGAEASTEISLGKVTKVNIPGEGVGSSVTAAISGGKVTSLAVQPGSAWLRPPIVVFEGGGASSHATGTATLDVNGGIANIAVDNPGSGYKTAPSVRLLPSTGYDYTSPPTVIVGGGNGYGARIEAVMQWYVSYITIDNWGKCSWTGEDGEVFVETPVNGGGASAEIISTPDALEPATIKQARWKIIAPSSAAQVGIWNYADANIEFPVPSSETSPQYWLQNYEFDFPEVSVDTVFEVEFPKYVIDPETDEETTELNYTNALSGETITSRVTVINNVAGFNDIDLKVAGTPVPFSINQRLLADEEICLFYSSDGVTDGLVTIELDYHYLNGFEVFEQSGEPSLTTRTAVGGDVYAWNAVRYANIFELDDPKRTPVDGWKEGTTIWLDDGRNKEEVGQPWKANKQYGFHEVAVVDGVSYRSIKGGDGLKATAEVDPSGGLLSVSLEGINKTFTADPVVTVTGEGEGAEGVVLLTATSIYKILVKNPDTNSGYKGTEIIKIEPKNVKGTGASAVISKLSDTGSILEVTVMNGGRNFDGTPIVTIEGDTSSNPVILEAVLAPSRPKSLLWKNRGTGYNVESTVITIAVVSTNQQTFNPQEWEKIDETPKLWAVYDRVNGAWFKTREETLKVDVALIESAEIYNVKSQDTLQVLQIFDPYKGMIPGIVKKELTYIIEFDPAVYNRGSLANNNSLNHWDSLQVGDLWWDISTTRYLDYEIGDLDYKWKHWGSLAPKIEIEIYEWVRSTVAPASWDDLVLNSRSVVYGPEDHKPSGVVRNEEDFVMKSEFNNASGRNENVYYFWVKNAYTLPVGKKRDFSAIQIANTLQNPQTSDFPWFAIVEPNKMLVGGGKQFVNDDSTAINVKWLITKNEGNHHKEWSMIREKDSRNSVHSGLWSKMTDSLVGYSISNKEVKVSTRIIAEVDSESTEILVEDASGFLDSGDFKWDRYWISYTYKAGNVLKGVTGIGNLVIPAGADIHQIYQETDSKRIPEIWLNEQERYGNLTLPAQTWFKVDEDQHGFLRVGYEARKTLVDTLNGIFAREPMLDTRFEWRGIFDSYDKEPEANEYQYRVSSLEERDNLVTLDAIEEGQKVLMDGIESTYGFWTLWKYDPSALITTDNGFVNVGTQRWRIQDGEFWEATDWYAEGWSANDYPVRYFETVNDRDHARDVDVSLFSGTLARVARLSETDRRWSWAVYTDEGWKEVAREKATIRLTDKFYQKNSVIFGFENNNVDMINRRDGSWEIKHILDGLWQKVLTRLERNEMFFSMVKTAVSQHDNVDWVFKTSFMYVSGFEEQLIQSPVALPNFADKIIEYIEDVKPYHVKIRDFARRYAAPLQIANMVATDFDKPMWYDDKAAGWRLLNVKNPADEQIIKNDSNLRWWYENYKKTNYSIENWDENFNPVRRPEIELVFDRISCQPLIGWDVVEVPWDSSESRWKKDVYYPSLGELIVKYRTGKDKDYTYHVVLNSIERDQMAVDNSKAINDGKPAIIRTGDVITQSEDERTYMWTGENWTEFWSVGWDDNYRGGAADRVEQFYEPGYGMRAKDISVLFEGCSFGGTEVDGGQNTYGLWDVFEWDHSSGWDNEYSYYIGFDVSLNDNDTTFTKAEGEASISIDGGELAQPWFSKGNPEELARMVVKEPISIKVFKTATAQGDWPTNIPTTYHFFKDSFGKWSASYVQETNITLAKITAADADTIEIVQAGGLTLHDPQTTDAAYLESIKSRVMLSFDVDLSNGITAGEIRARADIMLTNVGEVIKTFNDADDVTAIVEPYLLEYLAKMINGVVWLGNEKITYGGIDYSRSAQDIYVLTGCQRGIDGTPRKERNFTGDKIYDGSVLHNFQTFNKVDLRPSNVAEYKDLWSEWTKMAVAEGKPGPTS